jgi:hypothetical protein
LFTRSVQLIFSSLLQRHISKFSMYFLSTFEVFTFQQHRMSCSKWQWSIYVRNFHRQLYSI